ncbi:MAG: Amylo-alpha-1,6-glucosidase [Lentisphaerae bacterium ADurb.BinA184]|nr:MAG: Amylo-alpha-1,6-glucosidase [Lentisphaerae bacterium ADurb.BinA184]
MKSAFDRNDGYGFEGWLAREWLDTNGRGGYASGTLLNGHTRKYHGLLVVRLARPAGVFVMLSQLEDELTTPAGAFPLVTHEYPGTFHPAGHNTQCRFEQDLCPTFTYACGEARLRRRVMMVRGSDTVLIRYDLDGPPGPATLRIRPLLAGRDFHHVATENPAANLDADLRRHGIVCRPYPGLPPLHLDGDRPLAFTPEKLWYRHVLYRLDQERGLEHCEDLLSPGQFTVTLTPDRPLVIAASCTGPSRAPGRLWDEEWERRRAAAAAVEARMPRGRAVAEPARRLFEALSEAADRLLITLPDGTPAVHAGYHWFGPWGRDTLIALPGLAFVTGRLDEGMAILEATVAKASKGMLPNFLNPDGTGAYTAADPALWLFWTVQQYLHFGGRLETVRDRLWPAMRDIITHYHDGTEAGIRARHDGLLTAGRPELAVTWMDASLHGRPIIQRWGLIVELNALWYNALCLSFELARTFKTPLPGLPPTLCDDVRRAFVETFWNPASHTLYDSVSGAFSDPSVRPNQIFALSLPHSPLDEQRQLEVLDSFEAEGLCTPYGIRTLSPLDPRYQGVCRGPEWARELAYQQGSVLPWILAHYADAVFRVFGRSEFTVARFDPAVRALADHLNEAGIGGLSEIFEGDPPHVPRGSICQAWNVGEILRLLHELYRED